VHCNVIAVWEATRNSELEEDGFMPQSEGAAAGVEDA